MEIFRMCLGQAGTGPVVDPVTAQQVVGIITGMWRWDDPLLIYSSSKRPGIRGCGT